MDNSKLEFDNGEGQIDVNTFGEIIGYFDKNLLVGAEFERVVAINQTSPGCSSEQTRNRKNKKYYDRARTVRKRTRKASQ